MREGRPLGNTFLSCIGAGMGGVFGMMFGAAEATLTS